MVMIHKEDWRKTLLAARRQLSEDARTAETEATIHHARRFLTASPQTTVALYMPMFGELSPLGLLDAVAVACVPVIEGDGVMRFARMNANTPMQPNRFGIPEPRTPEWVNPTLVCTPLVGVDMHGHRLGYGKGYYDRYFASDAGAQTFRLGFAFRCQYVEILPTELHDLPLHALATAEGVVQFG
jgi:5-formyltetrahydrofolate cyclo-ligase